MKSTKKCDLHVHTKYSYDNPSFNTFEGYAQKAVELGVDVVCFTDHVECGYPNTFDSFAFGERADEFEKARQKYARDVKLLLGFEMGSPHRHPQQLAFLRSLGADMIIGSVHYPCQYHGINYRLSQREYEKLYNAEVRQMVEFGGFDVLGHVDMPKKYHRDYLPDEDFVRNTLKLCLEKGIIPEVNTSSLRNTDTPCLCRQTMASVDDALYYASIGGKYIVVNSDSHRICDLCCDFDTVYNQIGDKLQLCYFEKGKLVPLD